MMKVLKKMFSIYGIIVVILIIFVLVSVYKHGVMYNERIEGFEEPSEKFEVKTSIMKYTTRSIPIYMMNYVMTHRNINLNKTIS